MGWLTSCDDTNKIVTMPGWSWVEQMSTPSGSVGFGGTATYHQLIRRHVETTYEYVGLTQAAAESYVASNPANDGTYHSGSPGYWARIKECRPVRDGDGGAYKVIRTDEVIYDWAAAPS